MKIAELVLKYLEALVWPSVVVSLACFFRGELQDLFRRVTRLETPAGSMDFGAEARRVHEEAEAVEIETPADGGEADTELRRPRPARSSLIDEALELLEASPDAAVILAWRELEKTYRSVLSGMSVQGDARYVPIGKAVSRLIELGLPSSATSLLLKLSNLRNSVVHGDATVTAEGALDYLDSCELVARQIQTVAPGWVPVQGEHAGS